MIIFIITLFLLERESQNSEFKIMYKYTEIIHIIVNSGYMTCLSQYFYMWSSLLWNKNIASCGIAS